MCLCVSIFLVAWFTFDPCLSSPELCFTPDNMTVTCEGFEHRVALGSVGFSRGVHFWEFTIDRFDADTDPSFGVARLDVSKEEMLGTYICQAQILSILFSNIKFITLKSKKLNNV